MRERGGAGRALTCVQPGQELQGYRNQDNRPQDVDILGGRAGGVVEDAQEGEGVKAGAVGFAFAVRVDVVVERGEERGGFTVCGGRMARHGESRDGKLELEELGQEGD